MLLGSFYVRMGWRLHEGDIQQLTMSNFGTSIDNLTALKNWVIVYSYGLFDQFFSVTYCNQVSLQCNVNGGLILIVFALNRVKIRFS